jgi:hypothetical protein
MSEQITLYNEVQGHQVIAKTVWPHCKAHLAAGRPMVIEIRFAEDLKTDKQRAYYHGCILANIAQQAKPNGDAYPLAVWKEFFRDKFLGFKTKTTINPTTGKKSRRRIRQSTEALGVKGYADLIEKVAAYAGTELGVTFPEEWTDPETGEVFLLKDATQRRAARERKKELGVEA